MKRQIHLNALDMNCVGCCPGLWLHPEDETTKYTTLEYWTDLARLLERGMFDSLFIADIFGIYDIYGGSFDTYVRNGGQISYLDPMVVLPVMAACTRHLGLGITLSTTFHNPYHLARWLGSMDVMSGMRRTAHDFHGSQRPSLV